MVTPDPFNLERFVTAQEPVFSQVKDELSKGRKTSHWMWFIFPQLRSLGHSAMAMKYGIASLDEARNYYAHPVLGPRLDLCTRTVLATKDRSLNQIFGSPDDVKFVSCMTLFACTVVQPGSLYRQALDRFHGGIMDERTLELLGLRKP